MTLRRRLSAAVTVLCLVLILSAAVYADTGPKPSVSISFEALGDATCYATLLSKHECSGPHSVWDGSEENALYSENIDYASSDYDIWKAFVDYKDSDGFYFLQQTWQINATKEFSWGYYPPDVFKLLLYFPESGVFAVSDVYEAYAFSSYYTVDMSGFSLTPGSEDTGSITLIESYDHTYEIIGLVSRIILTVALELCAALLFGYREKKQVKFIIWVNIVTQVILNIILNVTSFYHGAWAALLALILGELVVFILESVLYAAFLGKRGAQGYSAWRGVLYALTANLLSLVVGRLIMELMPYALLLFGKSVP